MRNKLLMLFLTGFLFMGTGLFAQGFVGIKFAGNIPGFQDPIVDGGFSSKLGTGIGLDFSYRFNDYIGVRMTPEYSEISRKRKAYQGFYMPNGVRDLMPELAQVDVAYADLDGDIKDKYLLLPVMVELGFNFNEKIFNDVREEYLRVYFSGGGFVGYLTESSQRIRSLRSSVFADEGRTEVLATRDQIREAGFSKSRSYINENFEEFTYGVTGFIGFSYHFFYRNEFFIEFGGHFGLNNLDEEKLNGEVFTRTATVQFGYRWQW